jgi:hypothetical protein
MARWRRRPNRPQRPRIRDPQEIELALGRIVDLTRDWRRYGELVSVEQRNEMRRALVIELHHETDKLADACGLPTLRPIDIGVTRS